MKRKLIHAVLLMLLGIHAGCGDSDMLNNTRFDDWCENLPCGWRLDTGMVKRVPTWHRKDHGVELVGMPAQISQRANSSLPADCVRIDMVASSDEGAALELLLDFEDDRSIDHRLPIPPSDFKTHTFKLKPPVGYESLRYVLLKSGSARASVGKLSAAADGECYGERIQFDSGAACSADASCKSGSCLDGYCSGCAHGSCLEGETCALDSDCIDSAACAGGVCRACATSGSCAASEPCTTSVQCAHGTCVEGALPSLGKRATQHAVCGECRTDEDCSSGHCTLGFCGECESDLHCSAGLQCRYADSFDASRRACLPRPTSKLLRGQLCELDSECDAGLRCAAAPGHAKRCGVACSRDDACEGGICARPGTRRLSNSAERTTLPSFALSTSERVATCYPRASLHAACSVHEQCVGGVPLASACCAGMCSDERVDRVSGLCIAPDSI